MGHWGASKNAPKDPSLWGTEAQGQSQPHCRQLSCDGYTAKFHTD